ncbi:MAG: quinol:electron acceptor oxidoreductase subunit ActD [Isosphaeraceae bacterium]
MNQELDRTTAVPPLVEGDHDFASISDLICGLVERPAPRWWWLAFLFCGSFGLLGLYASIYVFATGLGIWGMNQTVGWGFPIGTFVFWVGIGHAGTLISAILFLFRQKWRSSLNRAAEAMTLFAVCCAGLYVIIHIGRFWIAWYLVPLTNSNALVPNFRSALSWDFAAISVYGLVSLMFWYVGLIPDMATLRDRATTPFRRWIYGLFALGWRGSGRHWHNYEMAYLMLAGLATPLVVSVHTVVSFDFAISILPGWHSTIFPPYFVTGAIFSGLAMVITLLVPLRRLCGLEDMITITHLQNMCKLILTTSLIIGYAYGTELFMAWYAGNEFEMYTFKNRILGPYGWCFAIMVLCNVMIPQLLWFRWFRTTPWVMFLLSLCVNIGMWFERFVIVTTTLHRDYLPSSWMMFYPTLWDYLQLLGGFGLFTTLFLIFIRFLPMVAISEVKASLPEADPHHREDHPQGKPAVDASQADPVVHPGAGPVYGLLARFAGPGELLEAARKLRAAGYRWIDTYSPFPIHGMERALRLGRSRVPAFVFVGGAIGVLFAQFVQYYESTVSYALIVDGKPFNSAEAFVPISFETMILYASIAAVLSMLFLNGLPRFYHPVFRGRSFARASNDRFFLSVESRDAMFDRGATPELLASLGGVEIQFLKA